MEALVIEGQHATFQCVSVGIPDPEQIWLSVQGQLSTAGRVTVLDEFLIITTVEEADEGTYTCQASNVAGLDEASAELVFVGELLIDNVYMHYSNTYATGFCTIKRSILSLSLQMILLKWYTVLHISLMYRT